VVVADTVLLTLADWLAQPAAKTVVPNIKAVANFINLLIIFL
jgi:hypothetical protein